MNNIGTKMGLIIGLIGYHLAVQRVQCDFLRFACAYTE